MNVWKRAITWSALGSLLGNAACTRTEQAAEPVATTPTITDRIEISPEIVNNLGITFETAVRGKLGVWHPVPGQLEVPESRRWTLRAPARARLESIAARWQVMERDAVVATLTSPELQHTQHEIEYAERTFARANAEVAAARQRLVESEAHLAAAKAFERAATERLAELEELDTGGNALLTRELLAAHRAVTDAGKATLDAALARDALFSKVATVELEAHQAAHKVQERLSQLAVLTGVPVEELAESDGEQPLWHQIDTLTVRAPDAGVVVELRAAPGETVDAGAPLVRIYDPSELRFRGHLPEGDLGLLAAGNPVRLEFPSRDLPPIETRLNPPPPIADPETRMVHLEATIDNADGALAHGISVRAHVQVSESAAEEVLIPYRCVVYDGLEAVVFRRAPGEPNEVIRTPVELGARGAEWVEVLAGVLDGDSVVADGVHQLQQSGLGRTPAGGHVHPDGTWHEDHE